MQGGINFQRNHVTNQVGNETIQDSVSPLTSLPAHIIDVIISSLSIKDILSMGIACTHLRRCTDSHSVWRDLGAKLQRPSEKLESKASVVCKIQLLFKSSRSENSEDAMQAHIALSRIRLSSLASALASAKQIAIKEEERRAHPSSPFYCESFHDKSIPLIEAYLQNNDLDQAEEMIQQMVGSTMRGILAFRLEKIFLEKGDLQRALSALRLIKIDQQESKQALSLFIWNAKKVTTIDLALGVLNEFVNIRTARSCVKDFHGFLMEVGEVQQATLLQESYPDAFSTAVLYSDVEYYACNNEMDKAIQVAAALLNVRERMAAIDCLTKIIHEKGASLQNGQELLSRIRNLPLNINGVL